MKIINYKKIEPLNVHIEGAKNATIRWLVSKDDGAPNFSMRLFELEAEGYTPLHKHAWEHEVFILEGKGQVFQNGKYVDITAGDAIFTAPEEQHQFKNLGSTPLKFLCLIPHDT